MSKNKNQFIKNYINLNNQWIFSDIRIFRNFVIEGDETKINLKYRSVYSLYINIFFSFFRLIFIFLFHHFFFI